MELELEMVVSHHEDDGNGTLTLQDQMVPTTEPWLQRTILGPGPWVLVHCSSEESLCKGWPGALKSGFGNLHVLTRNSTPRRQRNPSCQAPLWNTFPLKKSEPTGL